jgi:hypothetical protein
MTAQIEAAPSHAQLQTWLAAVNAFVVGRRPEVILNFDAGGRKYLRVVESRTLFGAPASGRSVFCFVEIATGSIFKADGWKKPARGRRGHIADPNHSIGRGITEYGAAYAR